ncbi:unnamed protein product [Sympodiomycopsis kandeliae]
MSSATPQDSAVASVEDRLKEMSVSDPETILAAFHSQDEVDEERTLATLTLAQWSRSGQLSSRLATIVKNALASDDKDYRAILRLLAVLYAVAPQDAHTFVCNEDALSQILPRIANASDDEAGSADLLRAEVLSAAAGHVPSRTQLKANDRVQTWLRGHSTGKDNVGPLPLISQLALYKLHHGPTESDQAGIPAASAGTQAYDDEQDDDRLLGLARHQILSRSSHLLPALESLGYLSTISRLKESISNDAELLQAICSPSKKSTEQPSKRVDTSLQYAQSTIIFNLIARKPLLSKEQEQMVKLKAMANAQKQGQQQPKQDATQNNPLEDTSAVDSRCTKVIEAGGVSLLVSLSTSPSKAVDENVGQALLSLTTKQDALQRGKIIQAGGAKALLVLCSKVIKQQEQDNDNGDARKSPLNLPSSQAKTSSTSLAAMQSLSQLCITTSPAILFGPNNVLIALPFLSHLYLSSSSTPLQKFESLLALTNLASVNAETAFQVITYRSIKETLEESILLQDNEMIQKAALELLCNTISVDEKVFTTWKSDSKKLHLLLAFSNSGGSRTSFERRLAASAVLAILASDEETCKCILGLEVKTLKILNGLLVEQDEDEYEDVQFCPQGPQFGQLSLAIRGMTIIDAISAYIQKDKDTIALQKIKDAGIPQTIQTLLSSLVSDLKSQNGQKPEVKGMQTEIAQLCVASVKRFSTV